MEEARITGKLVRFTGLKIFSEIISVMYFYCSFMVVQPRHFQSTKTNPFWGKKKDLLEGPRIQEKFRFRELSFTCCQEHGEAWGHFTSEISHTSKPALFLPPPP